MLLTRSRALIKTLSTHHEFTIFKSISTFPFLSQEAQLAEEGPPPLPPPPPQPAVTSLPPNPAAGIPQYVQNRRNAFPQSPAAESSSLIPVGFSHQASASAAKALSRTLDFQGLMEVFAVWALEHKWVEMKQLFEHWSRSMNKDGKPNKPDVNLYNHYLRANLMSGALAADLLDLVAQMEVFGIAPNAASYNLVLKGMAMAGEADAALKLLERMLQTGKESSPNDESYDLVLSMLLARNYIDPALKYLDVALKVGYTVSLKVFNDVVGCCIRKGRVDSLVSVIEKCKKMDQNKVLCPSWVLCNDISDIAIQTDNSELVFYSLQFMAKWIARGEIERPTTFRVVDEGLLVSALGTAGRTYNPLLVEASWSILKRISREDRAPSPESYLAKISAYASLGNLVKAFGTLREFEATYSNSGNEAVEELFSPFTSLNPLVLASSKNGFTTLDEVYYQLENLSKADTPYKSLAALNCIILGCANIWDVNRAYLTFNAISENFGLIPDIHSYNALICAFGKLNQRDEATKVFEHFAGLGVRPNATTYSLLVDAHLVTRDPKAAISTIELMVQEGYEASKEMLKKVRRRCLREMDYVSNDRVESFAKQFNIRIGRDNRRNLLFKLDYSTESA